MDLEPGKLREFAQGIAYGFTPSSAAEEVGLNLSAIECTALASSEQVRVLVEQITRDGQFDLSLEHLRVAHQLQVDRDFAYRLGNPAAAINATVQRAKVLGVFVERFDSNQRVALSSPGELTPEEWIVRFGTKEEKE